MRLFRWLGPSSETNASKVRQSQGEEFVQSNLKNSLECTVFSRFSSFSLLFPCFPSLALVLSPYLYFHISLFICISPSLCIFFFVICLFLFLIIVDSLFLLCCPMCLFFVSVIMPSVFCFLLFVICFVFLVLSFCLHVLVSLYIYIYTLFIV